MQKEISVTSKMFCFMVPPNFKGIFRLNTKIPKIMMPHGPHITSRKIFSRKNFVKNRTVVKSVQVLAQSFFTNYRLQNTGNFFGFIFLLFSRIKAFYLIFLILWIILFLDKWMNSKRWFARFGATFNDSSIPMNEWLITTHDSYKTFYYDF